MSTAAAVREQHGHDESVHRWVPLRIGSPRERGPWSVFGPLLGAPAFSTSPLCPQKGVLYPLRSLRPCSTYTHEQDLKVPHTPTLLRVWLQVPASGRRGVAPGCGAGRPAGSPVLWPRRAHHPLRHRHRAGGWSLRGPGTRCGWPPRRPGSPVTLVPGAAASSTTRSAPYQPCCWEVGHELRSSWRKT